jgi:hypothetical protein
MAINSSAIRDTARMRKINKNMVISELKKASAIVQVNPLYLKNATSEAGTSLQSG